MAGIDVLILAAGQGERLGGRPKAFIELHGESLLERVVAVGRQLSESVIAAVPETDLERARVLVGSTAQLVAGGPSRPQTFRLLVAAAQAPKLVVLDVAHPLVTAELCRRVLAAARDGAAAAVLRAHDEVIRGDGSSADPDKPLYLLSKPIVAPLQSIRLGLMSAGATESTGLLGLLRLARERVQLVESEPWNVKLTTDRDLELIVLLSDRLAAARNPS